MTGEIVNTVFRNWWTALPLVMESFGFWTPASLQTLRTIAARIYSIQPIIFTTKRSQTLFGCDNTTPE